MSVAGLSLMMVIVGCGSGSTTQAPASEPSRAEPEAETGPVATDEPHRTRCIDDPPDAESVASWRQSMAQAYARPAEAARRQIPVEELAREADAALVVEIGTRLQDKKYLEGLVALNAAERNVWFVWTVESAAKNGGFGYFFTNYSGDCAAQTLPALRTVGLAHLADVFETVLAVFPEPPSEDRATRSAQVSAIPNAREIWAPLEAEFSQHSTYAALASYIRANLADF